MSGRGKALIGLLLSLLALLLSPPRALAQGDSYEARPGLIRMGGFVLFYNSSGPLSFHTMTHVELPKGNVPMGPVEARSCQHGVSIPIFSSFGRFNLSGAGGDGSYRKILEKIREKHSELTGVYDVKVDLHLFSILGIYKRTCTEIAAKGFKLTPSD